MRKCIFVFILVSISLNSSCTFATERILIKDGLVMANKIALKKFLPEINEFELMNYDHVYKYNSNYKEELCKKYNMVCGIEYDFDKDGYPEYVILGINKDKKVNWYGFVLILSKRSEEYIRKALFPLYDLVLLKLIDIDGLKTIGFVRPLSDSENGYLYWNEKEKKFEIEEINIDY